MSSSEIFYTQFAPTYATYASTKDVYLSAVNEFIVRNAKDGGSMMDIGSGNGLRAKGISDVLQVSLLTLCDSSSGMLSLLKKIEKAEVVSGDISDEHFKQEKTFDTVTCLWNVLGHIPTAEKREIAMKNLQELLAPRGFVFVDVNNRYNIPQYGFKNVLKNIWKDLIEKEGTIGNFNIKFQTGEGEIETEVHIFSPFEMNVLVRSAGLKIVKRKSIHYKTGKECKSIFGGQLVYKLSK
jgi:SAM-dependent methyltransferase